MLSNTLSPKEMAQLIGASESSLKRWIDSGKLDAHKTSGGHRRIALPEAIDFIRRNNLIVERPDLLGIKLDPELSGLSREPSKQTIFEKYLLEGLNEEAFSLVLSEYVGGMSIQAICDDLIRPALKWIGDIWHHDSYGIVIEHRATDNCIRILNQLRNFLTQPSGRIRAIGGSPPGDTYTLPSLCVAVTLESEGIPVNNLGANVPFPSFLEAVDRISPDFVWLSISHIDRMEDFPARIQGLGRQLQERNKLLIVGGLFADMLDSANLPNLRVGHSMADLLAIVREIAPHSTNSTT